MNDDTSSGEIAIVGMAGRFPGARNIDEYWANLVGGVESIRRLTEEELLAAGVPRRDFEDPAYVRACPVLDDIDKFDAAFFGISPRDASVMDPAHRFFLEVAWEALEHSGSTGLAEEAVVGVYATSGAPLYWMNNVRSHREIMESMGEFLVRHTGNDMNFLATRASYDLDLRGPSVNVQTACSSALVSAHMARQSLLAGECDMALIGGATITNPMGQGYHYKEGEILSRDGHCRPFDHHSDGTVFGSGAACLVLKRLNDALDNGDTIYAVIKGSAVNNDGAVKVGYLAPGVDGQVGVIKRALKAANISARSISYVEAHGTGTSVGDPIELTALEEAFSQETQDKQFCGIGSVKSNIGHLGEAAGAASLIKVAMALKHRLLPPTLNYEAPNPRFDLANSPFFVNASLKKWESSQPLRAGITALGAGGTNCHLILEEPPAMLPGEGGRQKHLIVLSAKSKAALDRMSENLAAQIEKTPDVDLGDLAYTLAMGRRPLSHRRVLAASDHAQAVDLLRGETPARVSSAVADSNDPELVFTFPGGGAQYARMCVDLYSAEPVYKAALDECFAIIDAELEPRIRPLLFAEPADAEASTKLLQQPSFSLPTLFTVEYALARLFESFGIKASAYIGHSMGEYVAACLAGVFSIRDGLRLVHLRGQLFEKTQKGKMIGVSLSEEATRSIMPTGLSIAAVNAPELCVASGPSNLIEAFGAELSQRDIDWTPIHIDVAAHSSLLDPILEDFRRFCKTIDFKAPQTPIVSNFTGRWLSASEATDPEYWVKHLRGTVRFSACVETVLESGSKVFLEIGPGRTLTTLAAAQKTKARHCVNSVRHPKEVANDVDYALLTLGKVWAAGAQVDWTALYDDQIRNRIPLPTYPFEAQPYWVAPKALKVEDATEPVKRESIDDWFAAVSWEPTPLVALTPSNTTHWLVFAQDATLGLAVADALHEQTQAPCEITMVLPGKRLRRVDHLNFEIRTDSGDQTRELLELLKAEGRAPGHVVLLLPDNTASEKDTAFNAMLRKLGLHQDSAALVSIASLTGPEMEHRLEQSFFTPVHMGQAMAAVLDSAAFTIVTQGAFSMRGESTNPWATLGLGPAQVMQRELPEFPTRLIDLGDPAARQQDVAATAIQLSRELCSGQVASPVALRAPARWTRALRPIKLPSAEGNSDWLEDGDVVFISGGLGGMGLVLAEHMARKRKVKLALLSRDGLPERGFWAELLASPATAPHLKRRIVLVQALESLGSQVFPIAGDVTDKASLERALSQVRSRAGPIRVVLHAAGVMDDELLQTKSDANMRRVLGAKVQGTVNLDALISEPLKVFVVMSSVASLLGLPGQVDYTAANAFLDAFATDRQARKPGRTLAINWNAWRDVGMVVNVNENAAHAPLPAGRTQHPWLDATEQTPKGRRYFTDFSIAAQWLLAEHQILGGSALIPGTGFVELARAAFTDALHHSTVETSTDLAIELRQVTFLHPFQVGENQVRRLQIDVEWIGKAATVTIRSSHGEKVHMTAEVAMAQVQAPTIDVSTIRSLCTRSEPTRERFLDQDFVQFGTRWQNLEEILVGSGQALISLALNDAFCSDVGTFAYHPSLMDMATGAAQVLIPGFQKNKDFFVPFGYDSICIFAPISARTFSHVRLRPETTADMAAFDVTLYDESGRAQIDIQGFTMRRVDASAEITQKLIEEENAHTPQISQAMQALLREAITTAEGVVAFDRVLAQTEMSQVIASSVDVNVWLRKLAVEANRLTGGVTTEDGPSFNRPVLATDYVKPESATEIELAALWSKLLGIAEVGVLDDFFELGGNSLVAVRFFARVKKEFGISLPLSTLFQAPSIRPLAQALIEQGYVPKGGGAESTNVAAIAVEGAATTPIAAVHPSVPGAPSAPMLIRSGQGKLPLFFIHDGLGEVLLYRSLALKLDSSHPVYGLEPERASGQVMHTRIADMARAKVARIRTVQPHGPYLLSGLCAGGVIAFEVARQLQDAGETTAFIGIIDAADVQAAERPLRIARERLNSFLYALKPPQGESTSPLLWATRTLFSKILGVVRYEVTSRWERAVNAKKVATLRKPSHVEAQQTPDIGFIKLYEVAHKEHRPQGVFQGGGVTLFLASQGDGSDGDRPFREIYSDPLLGWQQRVQRPVQLVDVPGGHSSALQEPNVGTLAKEMQVQIDLALAKAQESVITSDGRK